MNKEAKNRKPLSLRNKLLVAGVPVVAVVVAAVMLLTSTGIVEAASSLPYIETVSQSLKTGGSFNILEIVQAGSEGEFGYYIDGQEYTLRGWEEEIQKPIYDGEDARSNYIIGMRNQLLVGESGSLNIMGGPDTGPDEYPMTWLENYDEAYPWERKADDGMDRILTIGEAEVTGVPGTPEPVVEPGTGEYRSTAVYTSVDDTDSAVDEFFRLPILEVASATSLSSEGFYVNPTWSSGELKIESGTGKYYYTHDFVSGETDIFIEDTSDGLNTGLYKRIGDAPGPYSYVYAQSADDEDGIDLGGDPFFVIVDYGEVSNSYDSTNAPYAVTRYATDASGYPDFRLAQTITTKNPPDPTGALPFGARFSSAIDYLTYVGTGGNYNFNYNSSDPGPGITIKTETVFYKGGFINNNWFLRHVLDRTDAEIPEFKDSIAVTVMEDDNQFAIATYIASNSVDMIVLTGNVTIDETLGNAIFGKITSALDTPIMFNYTLFSSATTWAQRFAAKSMTGVAVTSTSGVHENVFWTDLGIVDLLHIFADTTGTSPESYDDIDSNHPLFEVKDDIDYENFLREQDINNSGFIDKVISKATSIRYIINFSGKRAPKPLEVVRVLEIQPGTVNENQNGTVRDRTRYDNNFPITETNVRTWLGVDASIPVEIKRMSMYEFVGRIEDLNENYDMILIGASSVGINQTNINDGTQSSHHNAYISYNDSNMNGLLYTNVGDRYRLNKNLYNESRRSATVMAMLTSYPEGDDGWYRLSGNDITNAKMEELRDFASSGYPIIIDSRLITGSSGARTINVDRIDNSSKLYKVLNELKDRPNIFSSAEAIAGNSNIARYASLSKPSIDISTKPTVYTGIDGPILGVMGDGNTLEFKFKISNETDATPSLTTYDVGLYLDLNSDGRYKNDEILNDIIVRNSSGTRLEREDDVFRLYAGEEYTVTRQMPATAVGLYAWNLKVTKNGSDGAVRASVTDYTRIAPSGSEGKKTINVLQIASSQSTTYGAAGSNVNWTAAQSDNQVDLEVQQRVQTTNMNAQLRGKNNGPRFTGVYGKLLYDVDDFEVNIITVLAVELDPRIATRNAPATLNNNPKYTGTSRPKLREHLSERNIILSSLTFNNDANVRNSLTTIFNTFDMLIIGFDDCYGELSASAGEAIVNYINTGKAILFTHDTTSFFSRPNTGSVNEWGYNFNTQLRDAVKLDRYGISSTAYGGTIRQWNNTRATPSTATAIDNSGEYFVAYEPKSGGSRIVRDAHGYSNYHMKTSENGNTYWNFLGTTLTDNARMNEVTQVNKGKITTYPYNINITPEFNNGNWNNEITRSLNNAAVNATNTTGIAMRIPTTHEQYFQVNMNSEDIVVWYCLNSPYYAKNDVTNGYYIYNAGNVTYSGAGHVQSGSGAQSNYTSSSTIDSMYINEAKLFVNTMIAAYRAALEEPILNLFDNPGFGETYYIFPSDGIDTLAAQAVNDGSRRVDFALREENPGVGKSTTLRLSYEAGEDAKDKTNDTSTPPRPRRGHLDNLYTGGLTVYELDNNNNRITGNRNGDLMGGNNYSFDIPLEVLNLFNATTSVVTVRLEAETSIPGEPLLRGYTTILLVKTDLFPMS